MNMKSYWQIENRGIKKQEYLLVDRKPRNKEIGIVISRWNSQNTQMGEIVIRQKLQDGNRWMLKNNGMGKIIISRQKIAK